VTKIVIPDPKFRIVNFSSLALNEKNVFSFDSRSSTEIISTLRKHVDLPYVYVVSAGRENLVMELLAELKSIRSTCFPYALFVVDGDYSATEETDLNVIHLESPAVEDVSKNIAEYALTTFVFDKNRLNNKNSASLPEQVDVLIVGGGITGLYAANRLAEQQISFCVIEKSEIAGGIWSHYANSTSQVNTSEGAYRVLEKKARNNRDHSSTAEILEDLHQLAANISESLFTGVEAERIRKEGQQYHTRVTRNGEKSTIISAGLILAVNDRVGSLRKLNWENQDLYTGHILSGTSDETLGLDWQGKKVVIVGMGAFAIENARTALENGADHVSVVCRRHGTVCPKIIDYLNFSTPYNDKFEHDRKSNIRNMMLWKKLYDVSGATQPECWMGKIKHRGHTISVSDIWFIAHHLKKLETITGSITEMYDGGVVVNHDKKVEADIVVNCVGFHRNSPAVKELCGYSEMFNNNYIDRDMMYLADAYIDDDVFNSFFGSSVLEMTKFYMDVYIHFFNNSEFETMMSSDGIEKLSIENRSWSHYIAGSEALMQNYPQFYEAAKRQITQRTANFHESHDLETYIAQNRQEWVETHVLLSGRKIPEAECLPYVFGKLIEKKG